jgi:hypothetical protein
MKKKLALGVLAAMSLFGPILEAALFGRIDPYGAYAIVETLLAVFPIYYWYHADKAQRRFRTGPIQNAGVIAVAFIALPVYFVRSRGWKAGALASLKALGVCIGLAWLEAIGGKIGMVLVS